MKIDWIGETHGVHDKRFEACNFATQRFLVHAELKLEVPFALFNDSLRLEQWEVRKMRERLEYTMSFIILLVTVNVEIGLFVGKLFWFMIQLDFEDTLQSLFTESGNCSTLFLRYGQH